MLAAQCCFFLAGRKKQHKNTPIYIFICLVGGGVPAAAAAPGGSFSFISIRIPVSPCRFFCRISLSLIPYTPPELETIIDGLKDTFMMLSVLIGKRCISLVFYAFFIIISCIYLFFRRYIPLACSPKRPAIIPHNTSLTRPHYEYITCMPSTFIRFSLVSLTRRLIPSIIFYKHEHAVTR